MKISGFTFVRNAILFSYPVIESIKSLLPLCDELIIAAGKSDDDTLDVLKSINNPKIRIIETEWDTSLKKGGLIYSHQTNLALEQCTGDWCIYLQVDEVLHDDDNELIIREIEKADKIKSNDALLFRYIHFYGSYDYTGFGRQWYRREIRAFRNTGNVVSWNDAQGFRKKTNKGFKKLRAYQTEARVFHYGWVRPPKSQFKKIKITQNYYKAHEDNQLNELENREFDYNSAYELEKYKGVHPKVMNEKIKNDFVWTSGFNPCKLKPKPFRVKLSDWTEKKTCWRIGEFKDFIEVKK
jgi:glycosyltransferase involved in cell wall biosynthesis